MVPFMDKQKRCLAMVCPKVPCKAIASAGIDKNLCRELSTELFTEYGYGGAARQQGGRASLPATHTKTCGCGTCRCWCKCKCRWRATTGARHRRSSFFALFSCTYGYINIEYSVLDICFCIFFNWNPARFDCQSCTYDLIIFFATGFPCCEKYAKWSGMVSKKNAASSLQTFQGRPCALECRSLNFFHCLCFCFLVSPICWLMRCFGRNGREALALVMVHEGPPIAESITATDPPCDGSRLKQNTAGCVPLSAHGPAHPHSNQSQDQITSATNCLQCSQLAQNLAG